MSELGLRELVATLQSRPWSRRFLSPLGEAAVGALEEQLGCRLPAHVRGFYAELCGGEEDRGYLGLLPLDRAVANAFRSRLPESADGEVRLVPLQERDDGGFEVVVCDGPFADSMWLWDGASVSPLAPSGSSDWLRVVLEEVAQTMPPPLDAMANEVDLSGLGLEELPGDFARAVNATSVSMGGNKLTELPTALREMRALQRLVGSDNQLAALPSWIGELAELRFLELTRNRLATLPASLKSLGRLTYLGLRDNALDAVTTDGLRSLEELCLAGNRMRRIDGAGPPALRILDASNNLLTHVPS